MAKCACQAGPGESHTRRSAGLESLSRSWHQFYRVRAPRIADAILVRGLRVMSLQDEDLYTLTAEAVSGKLDILQSLGETSMLWWVSSSALVIALLGAVWLNIDTLKDASRGQRYVSYLLVTAFIFSLVLYGGHVIRSSCFLEDDVRSLLQDTETGIADDLLCRALTRESERIRGDLVALPSTESDEAGSNVPLVDFEVEFRIVRNGTAIGTTTFALAFVAWLSVMAAIEFEKRSAKSGELQSAKVPSDQPRDLPAD